MKAKFFCLMLVMAILITACGRGKSAASGTAAVSPQVNSSKSSISTGQTKTNTILTQNEATMDLKIGDAILTATLADNSSAWALMEKLKAGDLTLTLHDYGKMEKVGDLSFDLPTNNEQIKTQAGDLILYQGNQFVLYYDTNSWNFTRLGRIEHVTAEELRKLLGNGDVTITLSIK